MRVLFFFSLLLATVSLCAGYQCVGFHCDESPTSSLFPKRQPAVDERYLKSLHLLGNGAERGDGYGGEGYVVHPLVRNGINTTAILIHGLGGTGEELGLLSLALSFFSLNSVKFIIPTAPTRKVSILRQRLPSWFDIFSLDERLMFDINETELLQSVTRINDIVNGEKNAGVDSEHIFLIGFSQGGAVALTSFLRSPVPLAGCIGIATWLPLDNEYPAQLSSGSEILNSKQILFLHVSFFFFFLLLLPLLSVVRGGSSRDCFGLLICCSW